MPIRPMPPIEYLNEALELSSESPSGLRWKVRPRSHFRTVRGFKITNGRDAGRNAGTLGRSGDGIKSFKVKLNQLSYPAHRVVFTLANQKDPWPNEVDHIDRNPMNNSPENLRIATRAENARNKGVMANNTSGVTGVTWCKRTKKWMAQIGVNFTNGKKNVFLGRFDNIEAAKAARRSGEKKYHGEFSGSALHFAAHRP